MPIMLPCPVLKVTAKISIILLCASPLRRIELTPSRAGSANVVREAHTVGLPKFQALADFARAADDKDNLQLQCRLLSI